MEWFFLRTISSVRGPGKTRTHCGGNSVSCDVARPWQNVATFVRAARTQEMFLKIFRNILCVQGHKICVGHKCCARGKRGHIRETWSRQQCCRHNVSSFCRPLRFERRGTVDQTEDSLSKQKHSRAKAPYVRSHTLASHTECHNCEVTPKT